VFCRSEAFWKDGRTDWALISRLQTGSYVRRGVLERRMLKRLAGLVGALIRGLES